MKSTLCQRLLLLTLLLVTAGCSTSESWRELPDAPPEVPPANLPLSLREKNWTSASGSGSCVIASTVYHLRWNGKPQIAQIFRDNYAGGQTATSIQQKWKAAGIPYACTESGDPDFLEWASNTRRGAIIWYFDSHCVHFCGFSRINNREYALLCDNNRVANYIRIPKEQFLREWRGYGGFACSTLFPPAPSLPYQGYEVVR